MLHGKVSKTWNEEQRSLSGGSELIEQTLVKKTHENDGSFKHPLVRQFSSRVILSS